MVLVIVPLSVRATLGCSSEDVLMDDDWLLGMADDDEVDVDVDVRDFTLATVVEMVSLTIVLVVVPTILNVTMVPSGEGISQLMSLLVVLAVVPLPVTVPLQPRVAMLPLVIAEPAGSQLASAPIVLVVVPLSGATLQPTAALSPLAVAGTAVEWAKPEPEETSPMVDVIVAPVLTLSGAVAVTSRVIVTVVSSVSSLMVLLVVAAGAPGGYCWTRETVTTVVATTVLVSVTVQSSSFSLLPLQKEKAGFCQQRRVCPRRHLRAGAIRTRRRSACDCPCSRRNP